MTNVLWFLLGVVSAYFGFNLILCKATYDLLKSTKMRINGSGWASIIITFFIGTLASYETFREKLQKNIVDTLKKMLEGLDDGKKGK